MEARPRSDVAALPRPSAVRLGLTVNQSYNSCGEALPRRFEAQPRSIMMAAWRKGRAFPPLCGGKAALVFLRVIFVINFSPQLLRQTLHFISRGAVAVNVAIVFAIADALH